MRTTFFLANHFQVISHFGNVVCLQVFIEKRLQKFLASGRVSVVLVEYCFVSKTCSPSLTEPRKLGRLVVFALLVIVVTLTEVIIIIKILSSLWHE